MNTTPEARRTWAKDGVIGGAVASVVMTAYFAVAWDMSLMFIPLTLLIGPALGYVAGVAHYHRYAFLRSLLSRLRRNKVSGR